MGARALRMSTTFLHRYTRHRVRDTGEFIPGRTPSVAAGLLQPMHPQRRQPRGEALEKTVSHRQ